MLTHTSAGLLPGSLAGLIINPNTTQNRQSVVIDNTEYIITILGDIREHVSAGDPYHLIDCRLRVQSPCIDAGDNDAVPEGVTTDLDGNPRIADGNNDGVAVVDIGAFEYVYEETAFTLMGAVSRKVHGSAGAFDIDLPLDVASAGIEPRAGGPSTLVLTFSDDLDPAVSCADVFLSSGICEGMDIDGPEMTVLLSGVDGNACLEISLEGVTSAWGEPLTGDTDVHVRVLLGKVNNGGTGTVNISDLSAVKAELFQPVTADNFRADVYPDGVINLTDLSLTRSNLSHTATCE